MIHQLYYNCLDDHEVRIAEEELQYQAKEGQLVILQREMGEVERQLSETRSERDALPPRFLDL